MLINSRILTRKCTYSFRLYYLLYHSRTGVHGFKPRVAKDRASKLIIQNQKDNCNVFQLVEAYHRHGHKKALTDPLGLTKRSEPPELNASRYGLSDENQSVSVKGIFNGCSGDQVSVKELVNRLEQVYCGPITAEFDHLQTEEERVWFAREFESQHNVTLNNDRKIGLAKLMLRCQAFDHFLANKFTTVKRYGGEGGESMMGVFDEIFSACTEYDVSNIVVGMPHRGRLNFLTCLLHFPPVLMFQKMKGKSELPPGTRGAGDVLSHLYTSVDLDYSGKPLHVSFIPNPSHLEAVVPVVVGKTRAKQLYVKEGDYDTKPDTEAGDKVICLQVHGDASFSAQGIIAETFCFAEVPHFRVGGSLHLIVNNQLGFTTESHYGRSSQYCSDTAKINSYPVIHVNADYPEGVVKAAKLAVKYRQTFRKDVVIDLVCFRKWGHNELDDPSFTQPLMYQVIRSRRSIPDIYADKIVNDGICSKSDLDKDVQAWNKILNENLNQIDTYVPQAKHLQKQWSGFVQPSDQITKWDTGVSLDTLKFIGAKSVEKPDDWKVHPNIQKTHIERRLQRIKEGSDIDWATAEALAVGSLLYQGFHVRFSGQDVGRATFSHRHAMFVHQENDEIVIPLNNITDNQTGFLEVANSVLSEEAVLGFEYGFSLENPNILPIWEAQFGDFFNGAQIIIDTFVTCGESKWLLQSGLVMLLPHGIDGAGPEHSSCRMERFLQLTDSKEDGVDGDNVNFEIVNPTTPAQYFHLLRRQMVRNFRKPLIIIAPKVILRLPAASSSLTDMLPGTTFNPVLGDPTVKPENVTRIAFCSGKHYYALVNERKARGKNDMAIVRLESLCPFPVEDIRSEMKKYSGAKEFLWCQEEHRNMGPWTFVSRRFENLLGCKLRYSGRDVFATSATGIGEVHQKELKEIMEKSFA